MLQKLLLKTICHQVLKYIP